MDLNFSKPWLDDLKKDLDQRQSLSLYRQLIASEQHGPTLVRDGRKLLNLAGNDYLGLGSHPDIKAAAINAIQNQRLFW